MDLHAEVHKANCWINQIGNFGIRLLWHLLHLLVGFWYLGVSVADACESSLICSGVLKHYNALNVVRLRYLAVVVESEDAYDIARILQLLQWLAAIGVKHLCLYDTEGVLKKSKESIVEKLTNAILFEEVDGKDMLMDQKQMTLEVASFSDGKEGVAKVANLLLMKYLKMPKNNTEQEDQMFTEPRIAEALRTVVGGQNPTFYWFMDLQDAIWVSQHGEFDIAR